MPYRTTRAPIPTCWRAASTSCSIGGGGAALHCREQGPRHRLLAPERYRTVPNLPTITEAGLPGLGIESWIGLFAPARTPPEVLDRLRHATRTAAEALKPQFETSGGGLMQMPVAETDKFIRSEFELWTRVIRDAGIRLD